MRRSHYLMSKIAGRINKEGYPIASKEHHGDAYKYLGDLSPKKTVLDQVSEVNSEIG